MANKDTAKQWFQDQDKPTEGQFAQLFEWLRWKDEGIGIGDVQNLNTTLLGKAGKEEFEAFVQGERIEYNADGNYVVPVGYLLEKIIVLPGVDALIKIGDSNGGDEVAPEEDYSSANGKAVVLNLFAKAQRTIYFTGIPANSAIIFFKRLVKSI